MIAKIDTKARIKYRKWVKNYVKVMKKKTKNWSTLRKNWKKRLKNEWNLSKITKKKWKYVKTDIYTMFKESFKTIKNDLKYWKIVKSYRKLNHNHEKILYHQKMEKIVNIHRKLFKKLTEMIENSLKIIKIIENWPTIWKKNHQKSSIIG